MYYLHLAVVSITIVLCKVGLAALSCLLLGYVDLLEGQYREVADECMHDERVKASMVASLAERVDLSIFQCDVCMESIVLIRLHDTLHEYNRHLRDNKTTAKIGRRSSFVISDVIAPVYLCCHK